MYLSDIRAAISSGQRPSAVLLNDAYAGHRKWWNFEWVEEPTLTSVWTDWDYILLRVYQYMQDYTTQNGQPVWVEEDPDVQWEIETRDSFLEKELHQYRDTHNLKDWQTPVAKPHWEDVEPPSMKKWLNRLEEESQGIERPVRGRPPTLEELQGLRQNSVE